MSDTKVDPQLKTCMEQYETAYPKGNGFPSCKDLTAEENKLPEDERDPIKMLRPVGRSFINICASRKSITNANDSSYHSHNPDEYLFCQAEDKKYYVIWPSQQNFQDINDIIRITHELNRKQIELAGIKKTNDKAAKNLAEEGILTPTVLKVGIGGVLSGAYIFGKATHYFDWLLEKTVVSSPELTKLRRQWAEAEYGQEIIKEELRKEKAARENNQNFDRCTNFSNTLWDAKKTAFWDSIRSPYIIAAVLIPALIYEGLSLIHTSPSLEQPNSNDEISSEREDLTTEQDKIKFRSVRYGRTEEENKRERIKLNHDMDVLEEELKKENNRTSFLAKKTEEASNHLVGKTLTAVAGAAATGATFGALVPMVHYTLSVIKPWQTPEQTALSSLKIESDKKAYQSIITDGQNDAIKLYKDSCNGKEPPYVKIGAAHPISLPIPAPVNQSLPVASEQPALAEPAPVPVLPALAESKAPPISDAQADAILAQRSWMGWISDTVAPLKSFTNSIGVTSTIPTVTGQFATAGWGASIRTFFTIRPAPTPVRVR